MTRHALVGLLLPLLIGFVVACAADDGPAAAPQPARADPPPTVGCRDRVQGNDIRPSAPRDLLAGPLALHSFKRNYRAARRSRGPRVRTIKIVAIARAGESFTVTVPRRLGRSLRILYTRDFVPRRKNVFRPCPKARDAEQARRDCGYRPYTACETGRTQFAGGIRVDLDRDRCLGIRVVGAKSGRTVERFFFPKRARGCRTFDG